MKARFTDLDFRDCLTFQTNGEPVLVTDPTYLADVYNVPDGMASVVRQRGVIVTDFGGDTGGPVYWESPFALLDLNAKGSDDPMPFTMLTPWDVGCDSGSLVFLPMTQDLPELLSAKIDSVLAQKNGAALPLPAGDWTILFEQHVPQIGWYPNCYRNIVLRWEPYENVQPRLFPATDTQRMRT